MNACSTGTDRAYSRLGLDDRQTCRWTLVVCLQGRAALVGSVGYVGMDGALELIGTTVTHRYRA